MLVAFIVGSGVYECAIVCVFDMYASELSYFILHLFPYAVRPLKDAGMWFLNEKQIQMKQSRQNYTHQQHSRLTV